MNRLGAVWDWLLFTFAVAPPIGAVTKEIRPGDDLQAGGNPGWALQEDFRELLVIFEDGFESGNLTSWSTLLP